MAAVMKRRNGGGVAAKQGAVANSTRSGRFVATNALTEQQQAFVFAYIRNGGFAGAAASAAGYQHPDVRGYELVRNQSVRDAIRVERERMIEAEGGTVAWATIDAIMRDKKANPNARIRAAIWTLEAAGHGRAARGGDGPDGRKPLAEMSIAELEAFVAGGAANLEKLRAEQPQVIDMGTVAPADAPGSGEDPHQEPDDTA